MSESTDKPAVEVVRNETTPETDEVSVTSNEERKIFVGGLAIETTEDDIVSYFKQYGEIDGTTFKTNPMSGRSQGYAFVVFKKKTSCDSALSVTKHHIRGRKVSVEKAQIKKGKIFVFRLKPEMTEQSLREVFSSYGNVIEFEQPVDKATNTKKTFCFVTFDREDPAHKLIKQGSVKVNEESVSIGKVNPKMDHRMGGGGGYGYPYNCWGPLPYGPEYFGLPWGWDPYGYGGGGGGGRVKASGTKYGGRARSRPY